MWLEIKYIKLLQPKLRNFKQKSQELYQFSCPICGDSKNLLKARGYAYRFKNHYCVKCHNCGYSSTFNDFLKRIDSALYREYILEKYSTNEVLRHDTPQPIKAKAHKVQIEHINDLENLTSLPDNHIVIEYVKSRLIPEAQYKNLYYTDSFLSWCHKLLPEKYPRLPSKDFPRLVIPYKDTEETFAFQARALDKNDYPRYITVKLNPDKELVYGLNKKLNKKNPILVLEGPIDTLFIQNSVAISGSNFDQIEYVKANKDNVILVYDNEPRSPIITNKIHNSIKHGFSVCIWGNIEGKDINEMILKGYDAEYIYNYIIDHSYDGLQATTHFTFWKRC